MRVKLENAMNIVIATAILHNLSIMWGDIMPEEDDQGQVHPALEDGPDDVVVDYADLTREQVRRMGIAARDHMRTLMDPEPTVSERRRLGNQ